MPIQCPRRAVPFRVVVVLLTTGIIVASAVSVYSSLIVYGFNSRERSTKDNGSLALFSVQMGVGFLAQQIQQFLLLHSLPLSTAMETTPRPSTVVGTLSLTTLVALHQGGVFGFPWATLNVACALPTGESLCFLDSPSQKLWGVYRNYSIRSSSSPFRGSGRQTLEPLAVPTAAQVCGASLMPDGWDPIAKTLAASLTVGNVTCRMSTGMSTVVTRLMQQASSLPVAVTLLVADPNSGSLLASSLNGSRSATALAEETEMFRAASAAVLG
eukprot:RCo031111